MNDMIKTLKYLLLLIPLLAVSCREEGEEVLLEEDEALAQELSDKILAHYTGNVSETTETISAEDYFDEE